MDSSEPKVQSIVTRLVPAQAILAGSYSTIGVNLFTCDKAYAVFPLPTFIRHKRYLLLPLSDHVSGLLEKYSRRGWRFQDHVG